MKEIKNKAQNVKLQHLLSQFKTVDAFILFSCSCTLSLGSILYAIPTFSMNEQFHEKYNLCHSNVAHDKVFRGGGDTAASRRMMSALSHACVHAYARHWKHPSDAQAKTKAIMRFVLGATHKLLYDVRHRTAIIIMPTSSCEFSKVTRKRIIPRKAEIPLHCKRKQ